MKKFTALLLALLLMAALSGTALAASYNSSGDKTMTLAYTVAPTYTVTIPTDVTISAAETQMTISAEDVVVNKGKCVSVLLDQGNNFTVTTPEGAALAFTVKANGVNVNPGSEVLSIDPTDGPTGSSTLTFAIDQSQIQYAGSYTGTVTFTIVVTNSHP